MNSRKWYRIKSLIPGFTRETIINLIFFFRSLNYAGSNCYCPVCEGSFKSFYKSRTGTCPRCGASSRHRLFYLFLKNETKFFADNLKVLHFAPEHCFYKRFKKLPNINYLSADLNSPRAMKKIDITNIPFKDQNFDVVISSHVLEHIPNDIKAIQELYRVQNKSGWSIHIVPIDYKREITYEDDNINTVELREKYYGHHDHRRIYGKDYIKRLKNVGFLVTENDYCTNFSDNEKLKYGLSESDIIYYCKK